MKRYKFIALSSICLILIISGCGKTSAPEENVQPVRQEKETIALNENEDSLFDSWTEGAAPIVKLQEYIKKVTDDKSKDYIPAEDRIAVFDMDGTLFCEKMPTYFEWSMFMERALNDKNYNAPDEVKEVAEELAKVLKEGSVSNELVKKQMNMQAVAFSGMSLDEFSDYTKEYLTTPAEGFSNMSKGDAVYLPMVEMVEYLQKNEFTIYVVSGADRYIVRELVCQKFNIPKSNVIGSDVTIVSSGQGDTDGMDYTLKEGDSVVRGDRLMMKNLKMNKVELIVREIGKKPVLSFGNSSGDISMAQYTLNDNRYLSDAYMIVADDSEREYGNEENALKAKETFENIGCTTISMKNHFKTIYGGDVSLDGK